MSFRRRRTALSELMAEANEARREAVDAPVNEAAIRPYVVEDTEAGGLLTAAETIGETDGASRPPST